jgi:hypothetical protein
MECGGVALVTSIAPSKTYVINRQEAVTKNLSRLNGSGWH